MIGADLFCGLGGFSVGAEQSGRVRVDLAINHWLPAAHCFRANHPHTRVICARIDDVDPRNDRSLPDLDILLASPECTHHSNARGGQPVEDQKRATPWHVCVWAEAKRPKWIVGENVREFRSWGPLIQKRDKAGQLMVRKDGLPWMIPDPKRKGDIFRQWIKSLESLGYTVDHQILNAADFGAHTTRQRLFVVARREDVGRGDIPWPEPTHSKEQWRPAYEIIDWSKPAPSIFTRKRPLAKKTLRRIEIGLRKFCDPAIVQPFLVKLWGASKVGGVGDPLGTVTAGGGNFGLVAPFIVPQFGERPGQQPRTHSAGDPLPTAISHGAGALVMPFILPREGFYGQDTPKPCRSIGQPLPTVVAGNHSGHVIVPYMVDVNHGDDRRSGNRVYGTDKPLGTVTASNGKAVCLPFLTKYYGTACP